MRLKLFFLFLTIICVFMPPKGCERFSNAQEQNGEYVDFTMLSLEELKDVEIVSIGKRPEKLSDAMAAVFVITNEDIRRSGATTIADMLRLAPGVQVARANTHGWAISVRGFNDIYANKLLVLIDGRSVYSPIYSGVFWDVQDTVLDDIERIEIIRGPGSTIWGANAVNGVINIITRKAKNTHGWLLNAGVGSKECMFTNIRYGGDIGENIDYRIYAKSFVRGQINDDFTPNVDIEGYETIEEEALIDNWTGLRGGFRFDAALTPKDSFNLLGEIYTNRDYMTIETVEDYEYEETSKIDGGHVLSRWERIISDTSDIQFQVYYDYTRRNSLQAKYRINIFDIDFNHRFALGKRHAISWGIEYRSISDILNNFNFIHFDPDNRTQDLLSAYIQDEIYMVPDLFSLTAGSKFEHNDFTGLEIQPGIRFLLTPWEDVTFWGALSRSVRIPSRVEHDGYMITRIHFNNNPPQKENLRGGTEINPIIDVEFGTENLDSEELTAIEAGCRVQPIERLWIDFALFCNRYKGLRSTSGEAYIVSSSPIPEWGGKGNEVWIIRYIDNDMQGWTWGAEISAEWRPIDRWHLRPSYSWLRMDMELTDDGTDTDTSYVEGNSPRHQFSILSTLNLTKNIDLDLWLRYTDELPSLEIDEYCTLDARFAWRIFKRLEISVIAQNFLKNGYSEYTSIEIEPGLYIKVNWEY